MTPKEKARELVDKFISHTNSDWDLCDIIQSKQCALITVDEILGYIERMNYTFNLDLSSKDWKQVKQEIKKL